MQDRPAWLARMVADAELIKARSWRWMVAELIAGGGLAVGVYEVRPLEGVAAAIQTALSGVAGALVVLSVCVWWARRR